VVVPEEGELVLVLVGGRFVAGELEVVAEIVTKLLEVLACAVSRTVVGADGAAARRSGETFEADAVAWARGEG
jgi:hypothetical protein